MTLKLIVNDSFYIFLKSEIVRNDIIIWKTISIDTGIFHPTFTPIGDPVLSVQWQAEEGRGGEAAHVKGLDGNGSN